MKKIINFLLSDAIQNVDYPNGVHVPNLVGPQMVLRPQFVPGNFSFGISIGVAGLDLSKTNKIRFNICGPDGKVLQDSGENEIPTTDILGKKLPKEYQGVMMAIDIRNLPIERDGKFLFKLQVNDEWLADQIIPIFGR